jgi:predicted kinase
MIAVRRRFCHGFSAMFNVCPGCGEYSADKVVEPAAAPAAVAICAHRGHRHTFHRGPLFIVTGASCTGKTTIALQLAAALPDYVVLDSDILWGKAFVEVEGTAADPHPYRTVWLRMAKNIGQGGRPVVLLGSAIQEQFEASPERRYFETLHYMTLVCSDETLDARLSARPAWRGSGTAEVRETMRAFNRWLREHAATTSPPMTLLDTTALSVTEVVDAVSAWVRDHFCR